MKAVAALVCLASFAATVSAQAAPLTHRAGGPIQQGKYCWVPTDAHGSGWWDRCDSKSAKPQAESLHGRDISEIEQSFNGGGGGGDGGH